ncbi:hypothetical protein BP5796_10545 [Coleophoma crateriformis]|uniref:Sugar phosphate transporter domain-containing protein n=1 Tax=Coleophoma crateriformis TaxID=565419 RepID=A0A3D8QQE7_9HELO|nr:hypothetical protein BP5796_10545 [Coleophoma crateriformis]
MAAPGSGLEKLSGFIAILIWIVLSSVVILFNKWILTRFPFSITLTTWHMLFATAATRVLARTTDLIDTKTRLGMKLYFTAFIPIGLCFSMSLILSNMVYLYLSMSFIQMLKALGPVATLLACWSMGLRNPPPSMRVFVIVSVIVGGVMLASLGELSFVFMGFLIQLAAVAVEAYKNALQQSLLSGKLNMSSLTLLYYFAPICAVTNTFFIIFFERDAISDWQQQPSMADGGFSLNPGIFLLNGILTFALNIASVNVIKKTSSLVLTLAGIPKAVMLMGLDMILYQCPMTILQAIGFTIAGVGTYQYSQLKESSAQRAIQTEKYFPGQAEKLLSELRDLDEEAMMDELSLEYNEKRPSFFH